LKNQLHSTRNQIGLKCSAQDGVYDISAWDDNFKIGPVNGSLGSDSLNNNSQQLSQLSVTSTNFSTQSTASLQVSVRSIRQNHINL
jgi:hypothetical protein